MKNLRALRGSSAGCFRNGGPDGRVAGWTSDPGRTNWGAFMEHVLGFIVKSFLVCIRHSNPFTSWLGVFCHHYPVKKTIFPTSLMVHFIPKAGITYGDIFIFTEFQGTGLCQVLALLWAMCWFSFVSQKKIIEPVSHLICSGWLVHFMDCIQWSTGWWFQPIWKILVKLDHFPK